LALQQATNAFKVEDHIVEVDGANVLELSYAEVISKLMVRCFIPDGAASPRLTALPSLPRVWHWREVGQ
jgi:hypothetical protein